MLGCLGTNADPWYCNLASDLPNIVDFRDTLGFCTNPQPTDPGYPGFDDVLSGASLSMLSQKAQHIAWQRLCQCKLPPPPDNPGSGSNPFPVAVPNLPTCAGVAGFVYYKDYSQRIVVEQNPISGIPPFGVTQQVLPSGEIKLAAAPGYQAVDTQTEQTDTYSFTSVYFEKQDTEDPIEFYGVQVYIYRKIYYPTDLDDGSLTMLTSVRSPISMFYNYLLPCPEFDDPPKDPPPGVPPPPNLCCAPPPPDLSDIYERLRELQALIDAIPKPPVIGSSSIEDADKPYGVYLRENRD